jgi:16S rRNA C967 or C1407 C5-methylase (RsmB/RsmF family)/NOL1/NOP2/fmu family ribosome biogenesis protein
MQLPSPLVRSLEGVTWYDKEHLEKIHTSGEQVYSVRINPVKPVKQFREFPTQLSKIPWTDNGYYLQRRPSFTFDPLFHAGCYYVQEASSMFLEQALKQMLDLSRHLKVLDLCAAPGGKSTHIQSLISADSLLVSNEVIRSRANVLKENIIKWGAENVVITNNDPRDFSRVENYFDVIIVDAPCSGSGLFRRDPDAIAEWSEQNVLLCSQRQQRILADVWPSLKANGLLVYSTCSYSAEENEGIMDWISQELRSKNLPLAIDKEWGIVETLSAAGNIGYRFWPDKVKGEGFFLACFQKEEGDNIRTRQAKKKPGQVGKNDLAVLDKWIKKEDRIFIRHLDTVYAWPGSLVQEFSFLLERLRVTYSGVVTGELVRDKFIPAHALAMSAIASDTILKTALDHEQSIRYLQRKDIGLVPVNKGWQLVMYEHHPLGWTNGLANRINNYYPKEMRILKDN